MSDWLLGYIVMAVALVVLVSFMALLTADDQPILAHRLVVWGIPATILWPISWGLLTILGAWSVCRELVKIARYPWRARGVVDDHRRRS